MTTFTPGGVAARERLRLRRILLAGAALNVMVCGAAMAQEASSAGDVETILITGGRPVSATGQITMQEAPKSASVVTQKFIQDQPAAANPFQLINLAPGVNSNGRDATGTGRGAISVRGFQSNQIGLILDGVPVNDSGTFNVYPQEYIDAENLSQVYIMQGAGDADTPNVGETGGNIGMVIQKPSDEFHVTLQQALGDNSLRREFVRVDTGDIGFRTKAFISYSNAAVDVWRGEGTTKRQHVDASIAHDIGDSSRIALSAFYNTAETYSYQALTKAQIAQYGYDFNFATLFAPTAPAATGTVQNDNNGPLLTQRSNYYKLATNPFENLVVSVKGNFALTDNLRLDVQPYLWYGFGGGGTAGYFSETNAAQFGVPGQAFKGIDLNGDHDTLDNKLFYNLFAQQQMRPGFVTRGKWTYGHNELVVGFQYETGKLREWKPLLSVDPNGNPVSLWPDLYNEHVFRADGSVVRTQDQKTTTEVVRPFVVDTLNLFDDKLALSVGLQHSQINRGGINYLPLSLRTANANAIAPTHPELDQGKFVPSAGAVYHIDDSNQIFASATQTFRATDNSALYTPGVNLSTIQPETTVDLEAGYRYAGEWFISSVTVFNTNYSNRQQSLFDVTANTTVSKNIGGVIIKGLEAEVGTKPIDGFSAYMSTAYTQSHLKNDLYVGLANGSTVPLPTAGKQLTDTPEWLVSGLLRYERDSYFAQIQGKYTAHRFSTLTNDEEVPSFYTFDVAAGYTLPEALTGRFATKLVLSVTNLFDKRYLGGINFGNNAQPYNGVAANLPSYQPAPPRFISAKMTVTY
ncbi:TonB-dependent receptor [Nitrospirillum bahiense]|uniref:Iron complex outermembrane receptor protein n=1 Tax=Nitrospirillum amazonense TaxID=28077 RepID=A0A560G1K9_9PROT|nr:TonB-dependent receptor [Nitrospirillum amazonense]TWB27724.1 iron complex outermembrane receptor protein [Nitrospirillum amazonense]